MCGLIKRMILSLLILFSALAATPALSQTSNFDSTICGQLSMGDGLVCSFRQAIGSIGSSDSMNSIRDSLWSLFAIFIAYAVFQILHKSDGQQNTMKEAFGLCGRIILGLMVLFPDKAGLSTKNIPEEVFYTIQDFFTKIATPGSDTTKVDSDSFEELMRAIDSVGAMYDPLIASKLYNSNGDVTICTGADKGQIFAKPNTGSQIPSLAQGKCLLKLLAEASAIGNSQEVESLSQGFYNTHSSPVPTYGFGGLTRAEAVAMIKNNNMSTKVGEQLSVVHRGELEQFIAKTDQINDEFVLAKKEAEVSILNPAELISIKMLRYQKRWDRMTEDSSVLNFLSLLFLKFAVLMSKLAVALAFFLMTIVPVVVIPIGLFIYQLLWVTAPLNGAVKTLVDTFKRKLLPYAIGPGLFVFLSTFLVATMKAIPGALMTLDSTMSISGAIVASSLIIIIVSWYGFTILTGIYDRAREVASLAIEPLLGTAMKMGDVVGGALRTMVSLGMQGAVGLVTGGIGAAAVAKGAATTGGIGGVANLLSGGERGSIGPVGRPSVPGLLASAASGLVNTGVATLGTAASAVAGSLSSATSVEGPTPHARQEYAGGRNFSHRDSLSNAELVDRIERSKKVLESKRSSFPDSQLEKRITDLKARRTLVEGTDSKNDLKRIDSDIRQLEGEKEKRRKLSSIIESNSAALEQRVNIDKKVVRDGVIEAITSILPQLAAVFSASASAGTSRPKDRDQRGRFASETDDAEKNVQEKRIRPKQVSRGDYLRNQIELLEAEQKLNHENPKEENLGDGVLGFKMLERLLGDPLKRMGGVVGKESSGLLKDFGNTLNRGLSVETNASHGSAMIAAVTQIADENRKNKSEKNRLSPSQQQIEALKVELATEQAKLQFQRAIEKSELIEKANREYSAYAAETSTPPALWSGESSAASTGSDSRFEEAKEPAKTRPIRRRVRRATTNKGDEPAQRVESSNAGDEGREEKE